MARALAIALLLSGSGVAMPRSPLTGVRGEVSVQEQSDGGVYEIEGSFGLDARVSGDVVWGVLSDYDHLGRFISSLKESEVKRRLPHEVLLEQEGAGKGLLALEPFRVLLDVREKPTREIDFTDILHRDFDVYEGSWRLRERPDGWRVSYRLRAKPRWALPGFIGKPAFASGAADLLAELRAEIVRRSGLTN